MATPIVEATRSFERWLGSRFRLRRDDLEYKHDQMAADTFSFLRASFYRWAQLWPEELPELAEAPKVLAVGDLHVENFGTWRDLEGRLVWGVNDFDEAVSLPYTSDLVRLATSAGLAAAEGHLNLDLKEACAAIIAGYSGSLRTGGRPTVLGENDRWLRKLATGRLRGPMASRTCATYGVARAWAGSVWNAWWRSASGTAAASRTRRRRWRRRRGT